MGFYIILLCVAISKSSQGICYILKCPILFLKVFEVECSFILIDFKGAFHCLRERMCEKMTHESSNARKGTDLLSSIYLTVGCLSLLEAVRKVGFNHFSFLL